MLLARASGVIAAMSTAATNTLNAALNCKRRQLMGCPNILLLSFCRTPIKAMSLKYVWENATPAVGFFVTKPNKKLVDFKIASDGRSKLFHLMIKLDVDTERNALLTSFPCASVSETPDRISAVVPARRGVNVSRATENFRAGDAPT